MNITNDDDDDHLAQPSTSLADQSKPRKKRRTVSFPKPEKTTTTPRACTECGKEFFSRKALYGHMRCHPERHWRGINPPRRRSPPPEIFSSDAGEDYEIATCLLLLAGGGVFECSSCKKVFRSHQALGGHRATHKNVKGCFAMAARPINNNNHAWACLAGPSSSSAQAGGLDLNLPAAEYADDDECCNNYSSLSSSCDYLDLTLAL